MNPTVGSGTRATRLELLLAFALPFLLSVAFSDKAVQQDDWAYLEVGRFLVEDPAHWMERTTLYQGQVETAANGVLHGPVWLIGLGLAQLPLFGGHALRAAHLLMALMLGLLGFSAASLGARLGARGWLAGLALALSPAPLVLGTGLMTDLPMVALFSAALALAVRGLESRRVLELVGAGLLALLAALTRYHGLACLPLLAVLPWLWGRPGWRSYLPLYTALVGYLSYALVTRALTGSADHERAQASLLQILALIDHQQCLLAMVCALGGCAAGWIAAFALAPVKVWRALWRAGWAARLCAGAGLVGGLWCATKANAARVPHPEGLNLLLQWVFFAAGGLLLGIALWPLLDLGSWKRGLRAWRDRHGRKAVLCCWLLGFALAAVFSVPFGSTRYSLPALVPVFLGCALAAQALLPLRAQLVGLCLSLLLGVGAAQADRIGAAVYPRFAQTVVQRSAPGAEWASGKSWIWGELGFRWYLERVAGLEVLASASDAPQPGDRLLKSGMCTAGEDGTKGRYKLHPDLAKRIKASVTQDVFDAWPMRVHNPYAAAGFYHADAGFLPYSFSFGAVKLDTFQVFEVSGENPFFAAFRRARLDPWKEQPLKDGNILVQSFRVSEKLEDKLAIAVRYPGSCTFEGLSIPSGMRLELFVGEHLRVHAYGEPGPGAILRVLVNGDVRAELRLDARRKPEDIGWHKLSVELADVAGGQASIGFQALAQPAPEGTEPKFQSYINVGFAEPRFVPIGR